MSDRQVRGRRTVTIVDVAEKAGVSVATASRALSGRGYASLAVKERVHKAARLLNYRLNASARNLKVNRTNTIGLVITDITNPFFAYLASGVLNGARQLGYHVVLCATEEDPDMEREALKVLLEERVDGIIAVPTGKTNRMLFEVLEMGTQLVLVDRVSPGLPHTDAVLVDNIKGAYLATRHLIELNHRRIGMIRGPLDTTTGSDRVLGYQQALAEAGIPADPDLIQGNSFIRDSGYKAMQTLLSLSNPPTAVFAANNVIGEAAICAIRDRGLRIPENLSFVMFDDVPWASLSQPPITVVSQPTHHLGYSSLKLLAERLNDNGSGEPRPPIKMILDPHLIVRASCLPLANPVDHPISMQDDRSSIPPV